MKTLDLVAVEQASASWDFVQTEDFPFAVVAGAAVAAAVVAVAAAAAAAVVVATVLTAGASALPSLAATAEPAVDRGVK